MHDTCLLFFVCCVLAERVNCMYRVCDIVKMKTCTVVLLIIRLHFIFDVFDSIHSVPNIPPCTEVGLHVDPY